MHKSLVESGVYNDFGFMAASNEKAIRKILAVATFEFTS